ncbi:MAG: hypothetical protein AAB858_00115, partial [Patescibacteria group bacterium]
MAADFRRFKALILADEFIGINLRVFLSAFICGQCEALTRNYPAQTVCFIAQKLISCKILNFISASEERRAKYSLYAVR